MSSQVQLTSAVEDEKADLAVEEPQLRRRASTASGLLKEREEVLLGADKLRALHLEEDTLALLQRVPMFSTFSTVLNGLGFSVYGVRNSGRGLQAYAIVLLVLYLHSACAQTWSIVADAIDGDTLDITAPVLAMMIWLGIGCYIQLHHIFNRQYLLEYASLVHKPQPDQSPLMKRTHEQQLNDLAGRLRTGVVLVCIAVFIFLCNGGLDASLPLGSSWEESDRAKPFLSFISVGLSRAFYLIHLFVLLPLLAATIAMTAAVFALFPSLAVHHLDSFAVQLWHGELKPEQATALYERTETGIRRANRKVNIAVMVFISILLYSAFVLLLQLVFQQNSTFWVVFAFIVIFVCTTGVVWLLMAFSQVHETCDSLVLLVARLGTDKVSVESRDEMYGFIENNHAGWRLASIVINKDIALAVMYSALTVAVGVLEQALLT